MDTVVPKTDSSQSPREEGISTGSSTTYYSRRSEFGESTESNIDQNDTTDGRAGCGNTPELPYRIGQNPQVNSSAGRHNSREKAPGINQPQTAFDDFSSGTERQMNLITRFIQEDKGQDLVEYGLLAGFVSIAAVTTLKAIGPLVFNLYGIVFTRIA
jgi:Flp pilus assembly pilin Flp